ncbi:FAD-binding oxidoreductase [Zunongwangia sp. F260]|uniref:FAD-binding oxidoreductase n=1 Tax=Autumnicola lenta TaxID=3075593 RepID=A0ABU3CJ98_9FLAO|nr:FAD-binding oxidoreductase [Zunongwangia sp. F260]MDT0646303.1 FAD-binding oxidoreductase [Zunongwangia sp. F260]
MFNLTNDSEANVMQDLKSQIRGEIILPADENYNEARKIYNAMIDKLPAIIVKCKGVEDVITTVNFARKEGIEVAIRGGGHNGPGLALVDDGLVIDLSLMKGVHVDPENRTVKVEPGCTWGDVDIATHKYGLATVSGIISTTGVGGLTLGGGHGYLTRKYGLTIDNLLSADVVLADGKFVHTNKNENPDLFWALRGGGGNFGVITAFEFRLNPVKNVIAGPMFWPIEELENTLKWYRDWLPKMSNDVYAFYLVAEVPAGDPFPKEIHGRKVCGLVWCYTGPEDQFESIIQEARNVAKPLFEHTGDMPYPVLQTLFDGLYPPGYHWYWKGDFVKEISDAAVEEHKRFGTVPTTFSTMHLYPVNGAAHEVGKSETAWSKRDARWSMVIAGVDPDPANVDVIKTWAKNYWETVHPHTLKGSYINFMMEEGQERIEASYGGNYKRLQQVKSKYDPQNFFHINQNIKPKG